MIIFSFFPILSSLSKNRSKIRNDNQRRCIRTTETANVVREALAIEFIRNTWNVIRSVKYGALTSPLSLLSEWNLSLSPSLSAFSLLLSFDTRIRRWNKLYRWSRIERRNNYDRWRTEKLGFNWTEGRLSEARYHSWRVIDISRAYRSSRFTYYYYYYWSMLVLLVLQVMDIHR